MSKINNKTIYLSIVAIFIIYAISFYRWQFDPFSFGVKSLENLLMFVATAGAFSAPVIWQIISDTDKENNTKIILKDGLKNEIKGNFESIFNECCNFQLKDNFLLNLQQNIHFVSPNHKEKFNSLNNIYRKINNYKEKPSSNEHRINLILDCFQFIQKNSEIFSQNTQNEFDEIKTELKNLEKDIYKNWNEVNLEKILTKLVSEVDTFIDKNPTSSAVEINNGLATIHNIESAYRKKYEFKNENYKTKLVNIYNAKLGDIITFVDKFIDEVII